GIGPRGRRLARAHARPRHPDHESAARIRPTASRIRARRLRCGYGTVVVVVLVVVVGGGGGGQGSQTLPPPITTTPPSAVQVLASRSMRDVDVVQSAAVSQASEASLLHTPALVPSPGMGSLQVPRAYVQQRTVSL